MFTSLLSSKKSFILYPAQAENGGGCVKDCCVSDLLTIFLTSPLSSISSLMSLAVLLSSLSILMTSLIPAWVLRMLSLTSLNISRLVPGNCETNSASSLLELWWFLGAAMPTVNRARTVIVVGFIMFFYVLGEDLNWFRGNSWDLFIHLKTGWMKASVVK